MAVKNRRRRRVGLLTLASGAALLAALHSAQAEMSTLQRDMVVRRACEAAIWAIPAIGVYGIEASMSRDLGGEPNDVLAMSEPMESHHTFLTPNDVTPYAGANLTTKDGPMVVEVPPAGDKAMFFGSFVDAWQVPLDDVGPTGADEGKGAKYLFLPPGYDGEVPEGYLVYRPDTYAVAFAFRPVGRNGGTVEDQAAYARTLKVYRLDEADKPPETVFQDPFPKNWSTIPVYDITFFEDLNTIIQREPVLERDKVMMGMLASLGIEKGKLFKPNAEMTAALEEGLKCAFDTLNARVLTPGDAFVPVFKSSNWGTFNISPEQAKRGFTFVEDDRLLIDDRAMYYFYATYLPKNLGGGTFYLVATHDADGEPLNGTDSYKLNIPADTPADDFWSVIVNSLKTKAFVKGAPVVGLASTGLDEMTVNEDGSVDVYFSPQPPIGLENNWIKTGEDFFLLFRLYGPTDGWQEQGWELGNVVKLQ